MSSNDSQAVPIGPVSSTILVPECQLKMLVSLLLELSTAGAHNEAMAFQLSVTDNDSLCQ